MRGAFVMRWQRLATSELSMIWPYKTSSSTKHSWECIKTHV
jgi:hypothetical protein